MKLNAMKTAFMVFNPTLKSDYEPNFEFLGSHIKTVEEMKILGLVVRSDLSWKSNPKMLTKKAFSRLWMIKRLKLNGANAEDLLDVYLKQVRLQVCQNKK